MLLLSLSASPSSLDKRAYNLTGSFVCCLNISTPFQQQTNYSVLYDYTMFPNFFQLFAALFFRLIWNIFLLDFLLYQPFYQMLQLDRSRKSCGHIKRRIPNLDCFWLFLVLHVPPHFRATKKHHHWCFPVILHLLPFLNTPCFAGQSPHRPYRYREALSGPSEYRLCRVSGLSTFLFAYQGFREYARAGRAAAASLSGTRK